MIQLRNRCPCTNAKKCGMEIINKAVRYSEKLFFGMPDRGGRKRIQCLENIR